jgi:hypothetical protein
MPENIPGVIQHVVDGSLYWNLFEKFSISMNYECTLEKKDIYNRLYLQIRRRF